MATYHCSVKVGGKGRGAAHAAYISREPPYARREGLEHGEHGNLPAWAQADPLEFWRAADAHERANGAVYREIEVALPRELTPAQRRDADARVHPNPLRPAARLHAGDSQPDRRPGRRRTAARSLDVQRANRGRHPRAIRRSTSSATTPRRPNAAAAARIAWVRWSGYKPFAHPGRN